MPGVFISYRREDNLPYAGRLCDRLRISFGKELIFMDVDTIEPGDDFVEVLTNTVGSCDVLLAVIGNGWSAAADDKGSRRLDNPNDYVRIEVATALQRGIRVIPVLVGGALMPQGRDLPEALSLLARRQALEIGDRNFHEGAEKLIRAIESAIAKASSPGAKSATPVTVEHGGQAAQSGLVRTAPESPWPGALPFSEPDQGTFEGRRTDIAELYSLIKAEPLTVVFGASGIGKTSLLLAGLFPQVRKDHILPIFVRLNNQDRSVPLIDQAGLALQNEIRQRGIKAPEFSIDEGLWLYLHRSEMQDSDQRRVMPLLVFDQLEEVLKASSRRDPAVTQFRIDLGDLVENRVPASLAGLDLGDAGVDWDPGSQRYRVLLSLREDFLPAFEEWRREIPSIIRNRMRILPMSGTQAVRAVRDSAPELLDESTAIRIVRQLATGDVDEPKASTGNLDDLAVEPALLSVVCYLLNERRKALGQAKIDEVVIGDLSSGELLADFYQRAMADVPASTRRFVEDELVTVSGFRTSCALSDAQLLGVREEDLGRLVDRRLLRIELRRGSQWIQLAHDLLALNVVRSREHRKKWSLFR